MKISEFVKAKHLVFFSHYRAGYLYYTAIRYVDDNPSHMYQFPVPAEDLDGATVNAREEAVYMMRYIRKAIKDGTMIQISV